MAKYYPDESKRAKETTGCKNCSLAYANEHEFHCEAHEMVPLIVFHEGFCFQFQGKLSNQMTDGQEIIMKETYEYSKSKRGQHRPRNTAAKIGIVTGAAGMVLSWTIDMRFIESDLAQSPALLAMAALAGLVCIAVSIMHLRSA